MRRIIDGDEDGYYYPNQTCPTCGSESYAAIGTCAHPACSDAACTECGIEAGDVILCRFHKEMLAAAEPYDHEWRAILRDAGCTPREVDSYLRYYERRVN